jgi:Flp pilus assembly CpaF family ATPase
MRPDRIIVGEVRGGEALDMLQAMNTGHEGSLSTAHANSVSWRPHPRCNRVLPEEGGVPARRLA